MNDSRSLLAIVAMLALPHGVLSAEATAPLGQNAPATQPGLPDPSGTARMSDVGDGTTPVTTPPIPITRPASAGKPDDVPNSTDARGKTPGATR